MSFELENPEIADIVQQYKGGYIGYGEAKNAIILIRANEYESLMTDEKFEEISKEAKELLLGKEEKNVEHAS